MRSYTVVHPATTICFVNPFVFKNKIEKEGLPRDGPAGLRAGGPEFKSRRPDQNIFRHFKRLSESTFTRISPLENAQTGGYVVQVVRYPRLGPR